MAASATASTVDPADEAGGEVVFSSDGLSPAPLTKPPTIPDRPVDDRTILDSGDIAPINAFEVFSGKVYSVKTVAGGRSPAQQQSQPKNETPLQRLARLQAEVSELEEELKASSTTSSGREFDEELINLASSLKSRLSTAASTRLPEQDELTRLIQAQKQQMAQAGASASAAAATSASSSVVYELYGTATNPTTTVQDRLTIIERLVGSSAQNQKSLMSRLEDMETLVSTMDAAKLDQVSNKAKVIRADLEAASKARNKLTATYKKEDSKMIQSLHQQMVELEGLSGHLPALTQRLQQLANLHVQASSFASRLSSAEEQANTVQASMGHLESTLGALKTQMVDNATVIEQNMQRLDERLNKLP